MAGGALTSVKVVEFEGLGPAPFACMLLATHGAQITRIRRPGTVGGKGNSTDQVIGRNRNDIELDLKDKAAIETCLKLIAEADVLVEGYRPGVMERLGLGPAAVAARNPRLVYARMTGWGQSGPLADRAGHDINYLALSGGLSTIGPKERPHAPLNLVADFGGGGMYLVFGVLAAVLKARETGEGAVIDCAMVDGVASLMSMIWGLHNDKRWVDERRANLLDGGCPFYDVYTCADGKFVAVGALEPQFYAKLVEVLKLTSLADVQQYDKAAWPKIRDALTAAFAKLTRAEACALLEGVDACVAPVLTMGEAPDHPHNKARGIYMEEASGIVPALAPRMTPLKG